MTDYYQTLGVDRTATPEAIKKAYRRLASQHHPDKGGDKNKFQEIEEAYRTLGDPQRRRLALVRGRKDWSGDLMRRPRFDHGE